MQALILAGGKGQTLRPLTIHTPKPLIPVANRPYLLYQFELLKRAGCHDITLALSYPPGKIEELFGQGQSQGVALHYAVEAQPLGTAGAYRELLNRQRALTVVLNGDILTNVLLKDVLAAHRELQAAVTIVTYAVENPSQYGLVVADEEHRVLQFIEKPKPHQHDGKHINAGIYVIEPRIAERIPANTRFDFESQLFPALIAAGEPVYALPLDGYWIDLGTPQRYVQAHHDLLSGKAKRIPLERPVLPAWSGEGDAPKIDKASLLDASVTLKPGVEVVNSVIGANCLIEEKARIENCVLWSSVRVGPQAVLRNSFAGKSVHIGRGVVVEGAVLGDKTSLSDYTII